MRKTILSILSILFLFISRVYADEIIYSNWIDYYPESVELFRIESEERYLWYKIDEEGNRHETKNYYSQLDDYQIIEGSAKTFYRVINNEFAYLLPNGKYTFNHDECQKTMCLRVTLKKFEETNEEEEEETPPQIINPETLDNISFYQYSLLLCMFIIIMYTYKKINLVLSKRF